MASWSTEAKAAIARAEQGNTQACECYTAAAEIIIKAMLSESLNQREIGCYIDRSQSWVSRLLKWYKSGCEGLVFGDERAVQRELVAANENYATVAYEPRDLGQLTLEGGNASHVAGEYDSTARALAALNTCRTYAASMQALTRESLALVYASEPAQRRNLLDKLAAALEESNASGRSALDECRATLREVPRELGGEAA